MSTEEPRREPAPLGKPEGGDPVCWLRRICPVCGRLADEDLPTRCPGCGAAIEEE